MRVASLNGVIDARAKEPPRALCIVGHPVAHSLSPVFQRAALQHAGIDVTYDRRDVPPAALRSEIAALCASRTGGNVTIPHKEQVYALCTHHTAAARRTHAVNTIWWHEQELCGHNTDVDGVTASLIALCSPDFSHDIVVLGAGGAAAAVLVAIEQQERLRTSPVRIVSRSPARAAALVATIGSRATVVDSTSDIAWPQVGLVVNATPLGMHPTDDMPVAPSLLAPYTAVFDLVYRREGTAWVHAARARELVAEDGLRMLVEQGAAAFACWFGVLPSRDVMWASLGVDRPDDHAPRR